LTLQKYFIHEIVTYRSVNHKGHELQEYCMHEFTNLLLDSPEALLTVERQLLEKMAELEKKYPRTTPFSLDRNDDALTRLGGRYTVEVESSNCVSRPVVVIICFKPVLQELLVKEKGGEA